MNLEKLELLVTMNILEEIINASSSYKPNQKAQAFSFISGVARGLSESNTSEADIIKYIRDNCYSLKQNEPEKLRKVQEDLQHEIKGTTIANFADSFGLLISKEDIDRFNEWMDNNGYSVGKD